MGQYYEGKYSAEIQRHELGESTGDKQTPFVCFTIMPTFELREVEGKEVSDPIQDAQERRIYLYITHKTKDRVAEKLRRIGFEGDAPSQLDPRHPKHQSLVGKEVEVYCKHEEYKGKTNEKWDFSGGGIKPLEPVKAKGLDDMMGSVFRKIDSEQPSDSQETASAPAGDGGDNEVTWG